MKKLKTKLINLIFTVDQCTQFTNPFPQGDLKATELQAIIKQEEEEDPIDGKEVNLEETLK